MPDLLFSMPSRHQTFLWSSAQGSGLAIGGFTGSLICGLVACHIILGHGHFVCEVLVKDILLSVQHDPRRPTMQASSSETKSATSSSDAPNWSCSWAIFCSVLIWPCGWRDQAMVSMTDKPFGYDIMMSRHINNEFFGFLIMSQGPCIVGRSFKDGSGQGLRKGFRCWSLREVWVLSHHDSYEILQPCTLCSFLVDILVWICLIPKPLMFDERWWEVA